MIKLSGESKQDFLDFLKDAYPELAACLPAESYMKRTEISFDIDSSLGFAWSEFDECCG